MSGVTVLFLAGRRERERKGGEEGDFMVADTPFPRKEKGNVFINQQHNQQCNTIDKGTTSQSINTMNNTANNTNDQIRRTLRPGHSNREQGKM
jgi:hypothetical protein